MWLWLLLACLQPIRVTSEPVGAVLRLPDGKNVALPAHIAVQAPLFKRPEVRISAPGYRSLTVPVRQLRNGPWASVSGEVHVVLVPEHGPSGTWTRDSEKL